MHGAIAAGSLPTAQAGAEILQAGGNAMDAAAAACFATASGEPSLTSLAGGGALLFRSGQSGELTLCDFFSNAPGLGGEQPAQLDFFAVELDFGPAKQRFHIGHGAAAVPGVIPGLCTALERWGRLPLAEVVRPACRFLSEGIALGPYQARAAALLEPILLHSAEGRHVFAPQGHLVRAGERFALPALATTLEGLAREDWRTYYREVLGPQMLAQFGPGAGGLLTREDLAAYEVSFRSPLALRYRDLAIYTNPPPATGGLMIALMLSLLQQAPAQAPASAGQLHALCRAMRVADEARGAGTDELQPERAQRWIQRFLALAGQPLAATPPLSAGPGSTTHISAIDAEGNAAAVTFSYGEGNGSFIADSGIMMNNLMGEEDLFPGGFHSWEPGRRLSTMVSPSIALTPDGTVTVLGTGGSNRIRSALTQVLINLHDHGMVVQEAVDAPRVHFEAGVLNAETCGRRDAQSVLEPLGASRLVLFEEPNLFFGGVHLVRRRADGVLEGAGDPRRGGVCLVV